MKVYIIEWFVDFEDESESVHEVLDGCGAFTSQEDALNEILGMLEDDKEAILEDYPEAEFSDIFVRNDEDVVGACMDSYDEKGRHISYNILELELHAKEGEG